ncbi:hypothetical protein [Helicobacter sp. 13S00477-4]|uniref:hypothetical protein n=1 Tax=Helicobacter sp. 13S00477-4 TaxID=1905759 RepID=UPI000BA5FB7A|nr:hypothetical protein [Helicobacter sp. 13S00477-4]PAF50478.1 hypothetical protein BKH44_08180 [Helicobacter sp. 13S00477-4]
MPLDLKNFLQSFLYFYNALGDESKVFFERLLNEIDHTKKNNLNEEDFINLFEKEFTKIQNKEIQKENKKEQIQEAKQDSFIDNVPSDLPLKTFTLPMNWEDFELNLGSTTNKLLENNLDELKNLNLYKEQAFMGNSLGLYARDNLLSIEAIKKLQKDYIQVYLNKLSKEIGIGLEFLDFNKNNDVIIQAKTNLSTIDFLTLIKEHNNKLNTRIDLDWNLNISDVKKFHKESKEFIDTFTNEAQDSMYRKNISNQQENINETLPIKKINQNDFSSLLDFFEKKRIENQNMAISKDEFKKDFLHYCKTNMNQLEMKTLLNLYHKNPTKLTYEHKEMIIKGMRYTLVNNNLLDKELELQIKSSLKIPLNNEEKISMEKYKNQEINNTSNQQIQKKSITGNIAQPKPTPKIHRGR